MRLVLKPENTRSAASLLRGGNGIIEKLSAGIEKMVNAAFDGVEKSTESEDKPSTSFRE